MNTDDIARHAREELRDVIGTAPVAGFTEFHRMAVRRQRRSAALVAVALVAVLALGGSIVRWAGAEAPGSQKVPTGQESQPQPNPVPSPVSDEGTGCDHERISCLGGRRYQVFTDVVMTWTLPSGLEAPYSGREPTGSFIESYVHDGADGISGVSVIHHAGAAAPIASPRPLAGVDQARELVGWISTRPFLDATRVEPARVGARDAWTVEVRFAGSSADLPAMCDGRYPCQPLVHWSDDDADEVVGAWPGMTARYTAVDLHGSGITVIWSWTAGDDIPPEVERAAASIRFQ